MPLQILVVTQIGFIFLMQENVCTCIDGNDFSKDRISQDNLRCPKPCPGLNTTKCGSTANNYADVYTHLPTGIICVLNINQSKYMIYVKLQTIVNNTTNLILVVLNKGETNVTLSEQSQK